MSSPTSATTLYQGSRRKAAVAALCGVGFLLVGWYLLNVERPIRHSAEYYHVIGWGTIVLFGAFLLPTMVWLLRPPSVSIDGTGFVVRQLWGARRYWWADIDDVWAHYHGSRSWVVWTLKERRNRPWWRLMRKYDGILSGHWDCSAEEIAWEMNAARDRLIECPLPTPCRSFIIRRAAPETTRAPTATSPGPRRCCAGRRIASAGSAIRSVRPAYPLRAAPVSRPGRTGQFARRR